MSKLNNLYEKFLEENGRFSKTVAGTANSLNVTESSKDRLIENLLQESQFNKSLLIVIMIMFVIVFGVGIYLALYYKDNPKIMGIIFGGSFLSLLAIIRGLQNLWKEKSTMDMLITIIPNMTPDKAVEIVEILYYSNKQKVV